MISLNQGNIQSDDATLGELYTYSQTQNGYSMFSIYIQKIK